MITLPVSVTMKAVETGDSMNPRRVNVVAVRGSLHGMDHQQLNLRYYIIIEIGSISEGL